MSEKEDDYIISRIAKHDDVEMMPEWKRWVYRLSGPLSVASIAAYFIYFVLRILYTISAEHAAGQTYWMAWAFIVVEIFVIIPNLMHRLWGLHAMGTRHRPKLRILGDNVPSVDVIITCCGEDDDLVLDTAKAACNVDYPLARFRVIICDDGNSAGLREKAERTARELFDNLYYRSRPKYPGVPHHFKAGNLNYALEETKRLPGGAANFFAALDADMIPERDWLRALIPHMLIDSKCCMACPPQVRLPTSFPCISSSANGRRSFSTMYPKMTR
jgi:cellulose synthase/poly-beta-1,6-N-acetylglucosamine synthase-like glycosyltransferase